MCIDAFANCCLIGQDTAHMLSLSSKYALRALKVLATEDPDKFYRVDLLSRKASVPGPYLSKIMKVLARREIIESRRGLSGGVRLRRGKKAISFYEVCDALEDPIIHQRCILAKTACNAGSPCSMHYEWQKVKAQTMAFLKAAKI